MTTFTTLGMLFTFGLAAGFAFQRSRLCFVSSVRDLFIFRATGMTRAILLLLLVTSAAGALAVLWRTQAGLVLMPLAGPSPLQTGLGGALFGLGMVLAGSCASGAMWRFGEGQLSQFWILLGVLAGTWTYVAAWGYPDGLTLAPLPLWAPTAMLAAALLAILWAEGHTARYGEEVPEEQPRRNLRLPWSPETGAVTVGLLLALYLAAEGGTWTVTRAFLFAEAGPVIFVLGMVAGGFAGARWGHEFRVRPMGRWPERLLRLLGGLAMGYGARMAWGCTMGVLMGGMAVGSPQPWYWLAGALPGAWAGSILLRRFMLRYL